YASGLDEGAQRSVLQLRLRLFRGRLQRYRHYGQPGYTGVGRQRPVQRQYRYDGEPESEAVGDCMDTAVRIRSVKQNQGFRFTRPYARGRLQNLVQLRRQR